MKITYPHGVFRWLTLLCFTALVFGCEKSGSSADEALASPQPTVKSRAKPVTAPLPAIRHESRSTSPTIFSAARAQVGKTLIYDPAYVSLDYPRGDLPILKGVCTDVVIRALRDALSMDLQRLVHEDMKANFSKYPKLWGLTKPDRNIDHRRVPNLQCYFKRMGYALKVTKNKDDYQPGDIVTCDIQNSGGHIMIVSDKETREGVPLVIHNIGWGAREEDCLFEFHLTGHYRITKEPIIQDMEDGE